MSVCLSPCGSFCMLSWNKCRTVRSRTSTHKLRKDLSRKNMAEPDMKRSTSWLCTLATQLSLCLALYVVLNLGQHQKLVYNGTGSPLDLYFISVRGGFRPIKEQTHLLKLVSSSVFFFFSIDCSIENSWYCCFLFLLFRWSDGILWDNYLVLFVGALGVYHFVFQNEVFDFSICWLLKL